MPFSATSWYSDPILRVGLTSEVANVSKVLGEVTEVETRRHCFCIALKDGGYRK